MLAAPASTPQITILRNAFTDDISKIGYDFMTVGNYQFQLARFSGHIQLRSIAARRQFFDIEIAAADRVHARRSCRAREYHLKVVERAQRAVAAEFKPAGDRADARD